MTRSGFRRPALAAGRHFAVPAVMFLALSAWAASARAQCTVKSGPRGFVAGSAPAGSGGDFSFALPYTFSTAGDRVLIRSAWEFAVYDTTNPASPTAVNWANTFGYDLNYGLGPGCGDGNSFIQNVGVSGDGKRALLSMSGRSECYASTLVLSPNGGFFKYSGDTGTSRAGFLAVQKSGSRYIAYGYVGGGTPRIWAADISDPLPGYKSTFAADPPDKGNIPRENTSFPASSTNTMSYVNPGYLLIGSSSAVRIVDVSTPGPAGSITAGMPVSSVSVTGSSGFNRPGETLWAAAAAVRSGKVYVVGEFRDSSSRLSGFALVEWDPTSGATLKGTFLPGDGFSGPGSLSSGKLSLVSGQPGVGVFFWTALANGSVTTYRLYATTVDAWIGGSDPQEVLTRDASTSFFGVAGSSFVWRPSQSDIVGFIAGGGDAYTLNLDCQSGPAPATGQLAVSNISTGTPVPLTNPVFVGDTLSITPSVLPPNATQPVIAWDLDLDYHAAETPGIDLLQLKYPDACFYGCSNSYNTYPDPPTFTLVGPCDPRSGGTPSTGAGCWNSVVSNGDFPSQTAGTTKTLTIAFEALNDLNTTTVTPATVNVTWKVPAVKVQNLSALLNGSSQANFVSASEGHPLSNQYKWYFGSDPAAPSSETLSQDTTGAGCSNTSSCTHTFTNGKGTYNAWLTATYAGGYGPDCANPCGGTTGSFVVTVTDFIAAFTASSTAFLGGSPINVTNQSQMGTGITPSYSYYLCDATLGGGTCGDTGPYIQFSGSGPWTIPVPATTDTWWLRIKATYGSGPTTVQWQPNVNGLSDSTAWPIVVSSQPPVLIPTAGYGICGVPGCPTYFTGTVNTPITVGVFQGSQQLGGNYYWQITGVSANPPSSSGTNMFVFTPTASGTLHVANTTLSIGLDILISAPPSTLSVSVSANPNPATLGTPVSLTASASGGSSPYTSYSWRFGDSLTGSGSSTSHTYAMPGSYIAQCTVTDSAGAQATGSVTVTVSSPGGCNVSAFDVFVGGSRLGSSGGTALQVGAGSPVGFVPLGGGGTSFSWNFGDGSPLDTTKYPAHTYSAPGNYTVTMSVDGGTDCASVTMNVTGSTVTPDFKITYSNGVDAIPGSDGSFLVVAGQTTTFKGVAQGTSQLLGGTVNWNYGDGTTGSGNPATKIFPTFWTYTVRLQIPGQTDVPHTVNVVGGIPTAAYSSVYSVNGKPGGPVDPNKVSTAGAGILFTSTGPPGAEYYWDFGDGTDCLTDPHSPCLSTTSHEFRTPGSYTVLLTVKLGKNIFQSLAPTTFHVSVPPLWIVPGLAYTSGLVPGSTYVSDVVIHNPSADQWAAYSAALLDGSNPPNWIPLPAFQPLESRRITNILNRVFGKGFGGPSYAMVVRGDSVPTNGDPAILAFTYNNNGGDPLKGTYGTAIQAVPISMAVGPGSSAADREFPGLRDIPQTDPPGTSAAYTNIGFVNAGSVPATVNVSFLSRTDAGPVAIGGPLSILVSPNQTRQLTQPLRQALVQTGQSYDTYVASNYYMSFDVVGDGAKVVPYAAVKDVASTDSIFLSSAPNGSTPVRLPAIIRASNATTGDKFRSRVVIFNPSAQDRAVKLTYSYRRCPAGQPACDDRAEQSLTLGANGLLPLASGGTLLSDDFVQDWLAFFQLTVNDTDSYIQSYLDVAPGDANTDPLIVRAETYNSQPNGNFGTQVPGLVPAVHGASPGTARTRLTIPYVVPKSGGSGYRTNVALVALGDAPAQAKLILHAPFLNSGFPGDQSQTIVNVDDKFLQYRLEQFFPALANFPVNPGGYYSIEIQVMSGTLAAFAAINDNVTSDGSLILAQPLP